MVLLESKSTSSMESITRHHDDNGPTILRRNIVWNEAGIASPIQQSTIDETIRYTNEGETNNNNNSSSSSSNMANDGNQSDDKKELVLIVLGCEANPPYGPYLHTAELFLDLLEVSVQKLITTTSTTNNKNNNADRRCIPEVGFSSIVLHLYPVSKGVFPTSDELYRCNGVIIPGSFNSAYDDEKWIHQLKGLIQTELVPNNIPALGVCFGHQIYAHSFGTTAEGKNHRPVVGDDVDSRATAPSTGSAVKCPSGRQAGRKTSHLTSAGQKYLKRSSSRQESKNDNDESTSVRTTTTSNGVNDHPTANDVANLDLFYTHGDMVETLPPQGVSLGGNNKVPIQVAMYFASAGATSTDNNYSMTVEGGSDSPLGPQTEDPSRVIAVTFQAHPEYASSKERGLEGTLQSIIREMARRGDITAEEAERAHDDAILHYEEVREQSIDVTITACQLLGWFPKAVLAEEE